MDLFISYAMKSGNDEEILKRDIDRLKKISKSRDFNELIGNLSNFTPIIEKLLDKYTLSSVVEICDTMKIIFKFYKCDSYFLYKFVDEYNNLLDLKENKDMYSKYSIFDVRDKMRQAMDVFNRREFCFTYFRNYLILCLFLFELPLKLINWTRIKLVNADFETLEEFDDYCIYLVFQQGECYFIFNKLSNGFKGQYIHKIKDQQIHKLLIKYLLKLSTNKQHFITNKSGKPITETNLSNAISNFTRDFFGKCISLNSLRLQYKTYIKLIVNEEELEIKKKLYKF
jgi:hypothetical protein